MDSLMPAIMISIQPQHCQKIVSRKKSIELRTTWPKRYPVPFKAYIYCTYGIGLIEANDEILPNMLLEEQVTSKRTYGNCCNGKVIAEFICDQIVAVKGNFLGHPVFYTKAIEDACLTREQVEAYCGEKIGAGWHISELKVYDKPRDLCEFGLIRPPQSWCYVKELQG